MASNFCRNCGFRLTEGKSFCGNCGTRIIRQGTAPAAPVVPAPVAAPVVPVPVAAVSVEPAHAAEPAVPEAPAVPAAEPAMPQPLQTLVTYHPEQPVQVDLPEQALKPVNEVEPVPAEVPAAPAVSAVPEAPVAAPSAVPAAMPAVPVVPAAAPVVSPAPAAPATPKKKSHAGLIIGLVCGGVVFLALIGAGLFFILSGNYKNLLSGKGGSGTILDRIETMEEVSSGKNYTVYNKDFDKKIESAKWWDYDGTMKSQGVYFMNTKTLAFSIKVDENTNEKLYYAFYYSKDDNFTKDDLKDPESSDFIRPSYYKDGNTYYNIECDKSLKPGHYCVIVSKDKNFNKPYVVAYAKILDQNPETTV